MNGTKIKYKSGIITPMKRNIKTSFVKSAILYRNRKNHGG
ncbi:hypothetical protein SacRon12I_09120 [Sulfolobus acidocaldarius Ron12/I]|uniref:Uncharacterized protein n=1 Tax=Sulfolobus acidocaldarius Ron12/I TaxID=1028567 RepID=M1J060_9CREN|nr:hypothetical protein SacRon12I_09120 [Sulfolobus acidocaldarius Ron12/I]